jgi:hypothetical protein
MMALYVNFTLCRTQVEEKKGELKRSEARLQSVQSVRYVFQLDQEFGKR